MLFHAGMELEFFIDLSFWLSCVISSLVYFALWIFAANKDGPQVFLSVIFPEAQLYGILLCGIAAANDSCLYTGD